MSHGRYAKTWETQIHRRRARVDDRSIAVTRDMKEKITLNVLTEEGVE